MQTSHHFCFVVCFVFCILKLLVRQISVRCSLFHLCHSALKQYYSSFTDIFCEGTHIDLPGISDLCLLLQFQPTQVCLTCELRKIFSELFLSSRFVHGNAWHFISSNVKVFVITKTEQQELKLVEGMLVKITEQRGLRSPSLIPVLSVSHKVRKMSLFVEQKH